MFGILSRRVASHPIGQVTSEPISEIIGTENAGGCRMSEDGTLTRDTALLRKAYATFNARDIEAAIALMHADVDWPKGMEGGRVHGHAGGRDYWTRQFTLINSHVEPTAFSRLDDGRVAVTVHQVEKDASGTPPSDRTIHHLY